MTDEVCNGRLIFSILRILRKIYYVQVSLMYFMSKDFDFSNTNTQQSYKLLSAADQERFPWAYDLDFTDYMEWCLRGARKYLLHQDPKSLPRSIIKFKILQVLHYSLMLALGLFVLTRVFKISAEAVENR